MFQAEVEKGLVLRLLEPRHAGALFSLVDRNREYLGAWLSFVEKTQTVREIEAYIHRRLEQFSKGNGFQVGIWIDDELAGNVGLNYISPQFRCTEIGYWLGAEYEGRGVMTKACRYLCGYLFRELKLNRIEIRCAETNARSRAIPERLGFMQEGKLRQMGYTREGLVDYLIYGLLADEWAHHKRMLK